MTSGTATLRSLMAAEEHPKVVQERLGHSTITLTLDTYTHVVPGMSTFRGRLILQKTVYLMQSMGIFLGYRFNWYVYGPYSPELPRHGFELAQRFQEVEPYEFHRESHRKSFDRLIDFLGDNRRNPIWLEAVASIHFQRRLQGRRGVSMRARTRACEAVCAVTRSGGRHP